MFGFGAGRFFRLGVNPAVSGVAVLYNQINEQWTQSADKEGVSGF